MEAPRSWLVVVSRTTEQFVHWQWDVGDRLYTEATSGRYEFSGPEVTREQHVKLLKLGWHAPGDPDGGRGRRNYARTWRWPVPWPDVVLAAISTLRDVYGLAPGDLDLLPDDLPLLR